MNNNTVPHEVLFGVEVPPGKFAVVRAFPGCLFRAKALVAKESIPGATRVLLCFVGSKLQRLSFDATSGEGAPTSRFAQFSEGEGEYYDTCDKALAITFWIANDAGVSVKWEGTLHGQALK